MERPLRDPKYAFVSKLLGVKPELVDRDPNYREWSDKLKVWRSWLRSNLFGAQSTFAVGSYNDLDPKITRV